MGCGSGCGDRSGDAVGSGGDNGSSSSYGSSSSSGYDSADSTDDDGGASDASGYADAAGNGAAVGGGRAGDAGDGDRYGAADLLLVWNGTDREGPRAAARNWAAKAALAVWRLRTARCVHATALAHRSRGSDAPPLGVSSCPLTAGRIAAARAMAEAAEVEEGVDPSSLPHDVLPAPTRSQRFTPSCGAWSRCAATSPWAWMTT